MVVDISALLYLNRSVWFPSSVFVAWNAFKVSVCSFWLQFTLHYISLLVTHSSSSFHRLKLSRWLKSFLINEVRCCYFHFSDSILWWWLPSRKLKIKIWILQLLKGEFFCCFFSFEGQRWTLNIKKLSSKSRMWGMFSLRCWSCFIIDGIMAL